jgi:hypothetical protein
MGAVAPLFGTITNAIELAAKSFSLFAASGERIGEQLGRAILMPFELAGQRITSAWSATLGVIRGLLRPFADFVQRIGQMLIGFLAEASPGPTYWIRRKWTMTVEYLQGLFQRVKNAAISIAPAILKALPTVVEMAAIAARISGLINPMTLLVISASVFLFKGIVKAATGSVEEAIPILANTLTTGIAAIAGRAWAYGILTPVQGMATIGGAIIGNLLAKAIIQHFDQIKVAFQGVVSTVTDAAISIKQQLSNLFASILPQLSSAVSIAALFAELSGLINPIEGLAIAIGNTIFGGIVESMGKSLDQVIPIFIRRFSLIAVFGGFLAQRLNFIRPMQSLALYCPGYSR